MMKNKHFIRNAKAICLGLIAGYMPNTTLAQNQLITPIIDLSHCSIITCGPEQVINGDFENGDSGFATDYINGVGCAKYAIVSDAHAYNSNWHTTDDHTNPTNPNSLFYVGDAPCGSNITYPIKKAWSQNVYVTAGEEYIFSTWASNLSNYPTNLPIVQLDIQEDLLIIPTPIASQALSFVSNTWQQICGSYTATRSGYITISIRVVPSVSVGNPNLVNVSGLGADFGLDDVSFKAVNPISAGFNYVRASSCTNETITFAANNPQGTHYWDFGSPFATPQTATGPSVQVTYSQPGTYTVSHSIAGGTKLGCSSKEEKTITVDCTSQPCSPGIQLCGNNLALNGDFEQGNLGFQSQYDSVDVPTRCGTYAIVSDAYAFHPGHWYTRDDHTYPNDPEGLFFVGDAQCRGELQKAWHQKVYVQGGTQYLFSAWVSNLDNDIYQNDAAFVLTVNGNPITTLPPIAIGSLGKVNSNDRWSQICGTYLSALPGWVTIAVEVVPSKGIDANGELSLAYVSGMGADFGLDDISFMEYCNNAVPTEGRYSNQEKGNGLTISTSQLSIESFPNPLSENVNIQLHNVKTGTLTLAVYDLNGHLVDEVLNSTIDGQATATYSWTPNSSIASGVYLLKVENGDTTINHKLFINK